MYGGGGFIEGSSDEEESEDEEIPWEEIQEQYRRQEVQMEGNELKDADGNWLGSEDQEILWKAMFDEEGMILDMGFVRRRGASSKDHQMKKKVKMRKYLGKRYRSNIEDKKFKWRGMN